MEELGPRLQEALLDRQREMDNWVTEWWLDDMYMKVRLPLPINSSPGMVFPRRRFGRLDEVADLAALFIDDLLDYKEMLDRGELPQERATSREKGQPLCMEQFYRLLGVCRVAEVGRDRLELPARGEGEQEELVIVACRNYVSYDHISKMVRLPPLCMEQLYRLLGVCRVAEVGCDRLELPARGEGEQEELVIVACRNYLYRLLGVCRVAEVGCDRLELPARGEGEQEELVIVACRNYLYRLLGVCRVAEVGCDRLELPARGEGEQEELVIVACRNYFYPIPVKAADRGRLTPGEMQAQLLHAMVDAAGAPLAPRVGLLTSMDRDKWAKAREHLIRDENNRTNLELISRALCIVCLDEGGGDRPDLDADTNAMLRAMHGAGTRHHSANRWFDKTVQLIISSDGMVGMCYEHSAAEGVAVVRLAERALARAEVADRPAPPPALLPAPVAMRWNITPDVQRTIETAARDLDRAIGDLDHKVYTYTGYGREFMKSCRASPDVYIQLALQYAYY
ncbi:choline O-acetyltransferase-like, partial [Ostrinia furnacalis]|uniref:choline O-acetyltransferase-like n=1 Tax=Ostrinia furnacalis TaxID=93504 RepID=UPI00103DEB68